MIFQVPQNFKRGQYILNRYRKSDAAIIMSTSLFSIISIISYLNIFKNNSVLTNLLIFFILILPVFVIYILFTPLPTYFNVLEYLKTRVYFMRKQKRFKWEGIHQFEEEDYQEALINYEEEDI